MSPSATPPDPDLVALAAEAVEALLRRLPLPLRDMAYPTSLYAYDMAISAERLLAAGRLKSTGVRDYMWREARERVLPDVVDPEHPNAPFDVHEAIAYATVLALDAFRKVGAIHADSYPEGLLDPDAAPGYAAEALLAWLRAERKGGVDRMWAYVRQVLSNKVADAVDDALRAADPDAWRLHHLVRKLLADLMKRDLERDEAQALRLAEQQARAQLDREGGFIERVDDPERVNEIAGLDDVERLVVDSTLLAWIRRRLEDPDFTELDRETWAAFEAAGFRGRDIRWVDLHVDPGVGASRLWALLEKLKRSLRDALGR